MISTHTFKWLYLEEYSQVGLSTFTGRGDSVSVPEELLPEPRRDKLTLGEREGRAAEVKETEDRKQTSSCAKNRTEGLHVQIY